MYTSRRYLGNSDKIRLCKKFSVFSTERLIEISVEYFIRGGIIQTLMGFHGVVEVDEMKKLNASAGAAFKGNLVVPHVYQGTDASLRFTVLPASFAESMIISSFKFRTVIRISAADPIRALGNDSADEKASCAVLGFVGKNTGYSSLEKSSMAANRHSRGSLADCPFKKGSRLVSKRTSLT